MPAKNRGASCFFAIVQPCAGFGNLRLDWGVVQFGSDLLQCEPHPLTVERQASRVRISSNARRSTESGRRAWRPYSQSHFHFFRMPASCKFLRADSSHAFALTFASSALRKSAQVCSVNGLVPSANA